jgi:A/G-specific adenine glycosylase
VSGPKALPKEAAPKVEKVVPQAPTPLGPKAVRASFTQGLMEWGRRHGRTGLPWQVKDAYAVWVSEIMLQQTQVETAKSYYKKFMALWPTVGALAAASEDEVMAAWAGLGYYRRAKFLHKAAKEVAASEGGAMPSTATGLAGLPGIGRSTAAAIASIAHGERVAIMDGNVVRVLARHWAFSGEVQAAASQKTLWATAEALVDVSDPGFYTQSIMDLGATVCVPKNPKCPECPVRATCQGLALGKPTSFPVKARKEKARRVESETWRVWHDGKRVALAKNENEKGVWQSMMVFAGAGAGGDVGPHEVVERWSFKHVFSHYDLHVDVELCLIAPSDLEGAAKERHWQRPDFDAALLLALPTPVREVVDRLRKRTRTT